MSATIYSPPEGYEAPPFDYKISYEEYQKREDAYIERLREWVKGHNRVDKEAGELIDFGVADGKAIYMVLKMRPLKLIHLDLMDGYSFQYIHLMTAGEVRKLIAQRKALKELFSRKQTI